MWAEHISYMRSHYTLTLSHTYCNSAHATILQYYPLANLAFLSFLAAAVLPSSLPQPLHTQLRTVRTGIVKLATVTIEPNVVWNCLAGVLRSQPGPLGCTPNLSGLCDPLVFSHALHLVGLSRTTLQRTLGPCQMVEQRCSNKCPPEFLFR